MFSVLTIDNIIANLYVQVIKREKGLLRQDLFFHLKLIQRLPNAAIV